MIKKVTPTLVLLIMSLFLLNCDDDLLKPSFIELGGAELPYDDSGAKKYLNVAIVALDCELERETNVSNMESMIDRIMSEKPETELIVFGETITGWYYNEDNPKEYQRNVAESIPGNTTNRMSNLADNYNIHIIFGISEIDETTLYNSQVVLNPEGEIIAVHRKNRLFLLDEESGFTAIRNSQVINIKGIRAGLMICADSDNLWLTKKYLEEKVDLVIKSNSTMDDVYNFAIGARRFDAWVISANRSGKEGDSDYLGLIYIADPAGNIRAGGTGDNWYDFYQIKVY
ncbi:MAG: carbon-nitrogen hydrolase family protein [Ignavibacteriae bacterium]|nr:carbon-nitrogen hydrolase family protein [Ignavibacteriota bacterium]